ncbi:YwiC-like family protein [Cohnella boryungensis]|uniref:YwiC-like family protein n=1 Tax=Cohnella boryungensis TaxID=768479 RepID=A0ABV8SJY9_9BACL
MKRRSVVIPHEHGGWAMISVPYAFGMMAGTPQWAHAWLFLAWLFFYLSSYPLLQSFKRSASRGHLLRWSAIYGMAALGCLIPALLVRPELIWFGIPLLALLPINLAYARRRAERAIANDLCAILIFSLGGAAAYLLGGGAWDGTMAVVVLFSLMHFTGSAFFVKTVFRERMSPRWLASARIYHIVILAVPALIGYPWMTLAFVYSTTRTFLYGGKMIRPWKAGIIEIAGALQFLLLAIGLLQFHPS